MGSICGLSVSTDDASDGGGLERSSSELASIGSGIRESIIAVCSESLASVSSLQGGASKLDSSSWGSSLPLLLTLDGGSRLAIERGSSSLSATSLLILKIVYEKNIKNSPFIDLFNSVKNLLDTQF